MLSITYQATSRQGNDSGTTGTIFDHPYQVPAWMANMPEPQHVSPLETWTPLAGDPRHVIHVAGTVSYWQADSNMIARLLIDAPPENRNYFDSIRRDYPDDLYCWTIKAVARQTRRIPRSDERYQEQLKSMFDE